MHEKAAAPRRKNNKGGEQKPAVSEDTGNHLPETFAVFVVEREVTVMHVRTPTAIQRAVRSTGIKRIITFEI